MWPKSLIWQLLVWAFLLFLVSIPLLWGAFSKGAEQISRNVVDTQILDFATQLRGYRASAITAQQSSADPDGIDVSMPVLVGDTDWVWQFSLGDKLEARSDLLLLEDKVLPISYAPRGDGFVLRDVVTPVGPLRIAGRAVDEAAGGAGQRPVHYIVGLSQTAYQLRVADHAARLQELVFFAVLPISIGIFGMLIFVVLVLRRTFATLDRAIANYEKTGDSGITGRFPEEIQVLVDRTNAILKQNQLLIDRTRKYVSKIAHDINHPLAVLQNAARGDLDPEQVNRQIKRMSGLVDRYASLARAIGPEGQDKRLVNVREVLLNVVEGFQILYRRTPFEIDLNCPSELEAAIPQHDLETMVSNLVSNAHKYADGRALITAQRTEQGLSIIVEDDGPGIPDDDRAGALNWGKRLDEAPPGTGFGLSIVADIADLYAGSLALGASEALGGLSVEISLPIPVLSSGADLS